MSDEFWSLKDKIIYEDGSGWADDWVYKKEDIEMLRQKLIEDFMKLILDETGCDGKGVVDKIINDRFGMEEKQ